MTRIRSLAASFSLVLMANAAVAQDFYAGKQINVIVGSAPGGGYDLLARLTARHMGKHIPGNPIFIVQNVPAAGSMVAANQLANVSPRDGTTIGLMQRGVLLAPITSPGAVRYNVSSFRWIGSLASETGVTLAYGSAPHQTAKDLFEQELIVGGVPNVDPETTARLYNALLGTKFRIVMGYNGTTAVGLAMERGEVQGIGDWSWSSLKVQRPAWIKDKSVRILMQGALERDKELPDVPNALDFVKEGTDRKALELFFTQKTVARPLLTPPEVPIERVNTLRAAFMALDKDELFKEEARKSSLDLSLLSGEAVDRVITLIANATPDVKDRLAAAMKAQ